MTEKPFKTIDEQIALLQSRGLTINNIDEAKAFLMFNNYYRISGYSLTLRKDDVFYESSTMQNLMDIYAFDHGLRHFLLALIETVEVKMKSVYAYEFAKRYGAVKYLDSALFTNETRHRDILQKAEKQRQSSLRHEAYLKHFEDMGQVVPIWAYVDLLTIADISILYSISTEELKVAVADVFSLHPSKGVNLLGRFMHSLTIVRNLCAHGSRLYNRLFQQKPSLNKKERALLRRTSDKSIDNAHLYGFLFIMKRMASEKAFCELKNQLEILSEQYPFVDLRYYGFREDWKIVL
ncbi:MAG: Abi family protein [Schwartzia sp.]|nr:Abi family protein [Schwartzia sp. (in: firmicutes)]